MISQDNIFLEIPCLTEKSQSLSGMFLAKKWFKNADKRYLAESLQKFVDYNKDLFDFLGVVPRLEGSGKNVSLNFKSDRFIGVISLRSPENGKQIGDFVVRPRYTTATDQFSEYVEIVNLLESEITPEFKHSIPLLSRNYLKPPVYLEAIKFVKLLEKAVKVNWRKFQTTTKLYRYPKSQIDWKKYIEKEFDPSKRLLFPCHDNILSKMHIEFFEIKYVYSIAKNEINSVRTPRHVKSQFQDIFAYLDNFLYEFSEKPTNELHFHYSDPAVIKELKKQGNKILNGNLEEITSWRLDFSLLFERYVQYLFRQISLEIGATQLNNYKIRKYSSAKPSWSLSYLEPDIVLMKSEFEMVVDAKYKSHLFNLKDTTEELKEEHRKDLHQLLAYTTFTRSENKIGILCYPYSQQYLSELNYFSPFSQIGSKILLVGVPMQKSKINEFKKMIIENISKIEVEGLA
ncbi:McrC family protein [Methanosarcina mazei]|uniref:Uncharacterized protein n=2 Tax=Methanosarcina mazei TaxID=2209 RepID=A0A0F8RG67_METMZ|nr:hypothetical protein [Methanosarcina mazei]AKB40002.1 hypothetical protein MSMAW_1011 [Methanosarcina mazei WWM610]KKG05147.1 hypothetical protein DU31_02050 [Methanosarcina mazei]KKG34557.1 hypothetical protein DU30_00535 [Methanosarcina mazei]KKG36380.1 hypothetical protein DU52_09935 [Methanosarcina mazei]KKG66809.1 hypothetical protein DU67_02705 [Methanosarcina mazei]